ncbi:MAG: hypothetical protein A2826_01800 [Candidatus Doudnabacteria bacterium RIFCSPHIGHO2_01_FULL_43_23]|uniref:Addiction module toxin, HicA family n=1 Tax=Candidatus Doudnabacteria bacterium RIFCSPHIGHO2_01_FULL_43_23 TaxID=1817822 RepID=A0A1F5NVM9_9BACT|nr:MAG: hypothetical protein A2826_01800 [Candidatus Doudnabacteria bacterium RIFCSPHIGHO2_01_FULL_43_23]
MSSRSFSSIKQNDWIKACKKLGLEVSTSSGKGSHCLVKHPRDGRKYTIQKELHKILNQKVFKKLESWGFSESQIWQAL